jgi:hypothetical protein
VSLKKRLLREAPYLDLELNQWEGGYYDLRGTDTRGGGAVCITSEEAWEEKKTDKDTENWGLVALGDIAKMAGANLETAKKWADRGLLPEPVAHTSGGRIWFRSDIEAWLRATGRL